MNPILQGLNLTVLGLTLTFAALGLFILVIVVLERAFRARALVPEEREPREITVDSTLPQDTEDEEVVAAITIALSHLRSLDICRSELGSALEAGHGAYWNVSLSHAKSQKIMNRG